MQKTFTPGPNKQRKMEARSSIYFIIKKTPGFVNYKKGCTRLAAASDKVYQLLAHGQWFSPGTPASSSTKTGCHDIATIRKSTADLLKYEVELMLYFHKSIKAYYIDNFLSMYQTVI
jgi:hypothetical protein